MARLIEYDVTGVEEGGGGTGVKVKPGVRVARIEKCDYRDKKKNGEPANDIEVALNFGSEYDWGFTYVGLSEAADWKLAEFIRALGLKEKGKLDPAKQVRKFIRVKVNAGEYNGEYSPDIGRLMPCQPGDEEAWAEGNGSASELSNQTDDDDGPDTEAADAEPDGFYREGQPDPEDPDEIVGSYDDWSEEDLTAEISDRELTLPGGRGGKKAKMIAALRADDAEVLGADDEEEEASDDEAEDAEPSEESDGDDYDNWDVDQLKTEWEERELGTLPAVRGSNAEARLKEKLVAGLREDDETNPFEA